MFLDFFHGQIIIVTKIPLKKNERADYYYYYLIPN